MNWPTKREENSRQRNHPISTGSMTQRLTTKLVMRTLGCWHGERKRVQKITTLADQLTTLRGLLTISSMLLNRRGTQSLSMWVISCTPTTAKLRHPPAGHDLDVDSRHPKVARHAARILRHFVGRALKKHEHVTVINARGNHDPDSAIWLNIVLDAYFEKRTTSHDHPKRIKDDRMGVW